MATRDKNIWILLVFILSGLVIGGLLGELASRVDMLWWLSYGESFGLSNPVELNLNIMTVTKEELESILDGINGSIYSTNLTQTDTILKEENTEKSARTK